MREQDVQTKVMIQVSQLGGIPIRLNSGKAYQGKYVNNIIIDPRVIKLCPAGTSDVVAIMPHGKTIWIECKTLTGKQREAQKRFQKALEERQHIYIIYNDIKKLVDIINENVYNKSNLRDS